MKKKYDIITVGSATIDMFVDTGSDLFMRAKKTGLIQVPFGSKIEVENIHSDVGGGGTNTAVAFSRLGFNTAFLGAVGDDSNGRDILTTLKKEKVDISLVQKTKEKSGFSVILDARGKDRTIIVHLGANKHLLSAKIKKKDISCDWFYFSSMVDKSFKTLLMLSEFAKKNKIKVMFNPSSYLARKGFKHIRKIADVSDILIMNDKEASLLSEKNRIEDMAKSLHKKSGSLIVITLGDKGAIAYDGDKMHTIRPNKVKVLETTGAGDAFSSGFLAGMIKKNDIGYALKTGRAQAESVIKHYGSKNKLLSWSALSRMVKG